MSEISCSVTVALQQLAAQEQQLATLAQQLATVLARLAAAGIA